MLSTLVWAVQSGARRAPTMVNLWEGARWGRSFNVLLQVPPCLWVLPAPHCSRQLTQATQAHSPVPRTPCPCAFPGPGAEQSTLQHLYRVGGTGLAWWHDQEGDWCPLGVGVHGCTAAFLAMVPERALGGLGWWGHCWLVSGSPPVRMTGPGELSTLHHAMSHSVPQMPPDRPWQHTF